MFDALTWRFFLSSYGSCYSQASLAMIGTAALGVVVAIAAAAVLYVAKNRNVGFALALLAMSIGIGAFGVGALAAAKKRAFMQKVLAEDPAFASSDGAHEFRTQVQFEARECTAAGGASSAPPLVAGGVVAFVARWKKRSARGSRNQKE